MLLVFSDLNMPLQSFQNYPDQLEFIYIISRTGIRRYPALLRFQEEEGTALYRAMSDPYAAGAPAKFDPTIVHEK